MSGVFPWHCGGGKTFLPVEAAHASYDELWSSFCVKDDESDIYLVHGKKAILKFNADHTNAKAGVLVSEE